MQKLNFKEPIAIIGMACRFPKAENTQAFWELLIEGVDAVTEVPSERWDMDALYNPTPGTMGKINSKFGGFIKNIDKFDADFFGINAREANSMDPQQRVMLEVAWHAIEDAGIAMNKLAGTRTGVYIGSGAFDYNKMINKDFTLLNGYVGPGTTLCTIANRISYLFDLRGPSMAIDTACSSSLVATHLACQSLKNNECDLILAGAVNLILSPETSITFSQSGMLSDRCKTFDSTADGYVRSEGAAIIVLKRYSDALRDNDRVYGLIKGSAVHQDGLSNGITAPNGLAQQSVITEAINDAGVSPDKISYIETHGTGTRLGDPIEVNALKKAIGKNRSAENQCVLGAVKSNLGHLEAAAGMAGLLKSTLALQHKIIPKNLHFNTVNPIIEKAVQEAHFILPTKNINWNFSQNKRIAGVSSFGFGGTISHIILEEALVSELDNTSEDERLEYIFCLSAKNDPALKYLAQSYIDCLSNNSTGNLADICYSVNTGRVAFDYRFACIVESNDQLINTLRLFLSGENSKNSIYCDKKRKQTNELSLVLSSSFNLNIVEVEKIYFSQPLIKHYFDQCHSIIEKNIGVSIRSLCSSKKHLHTTQFILQYAIINSIVDMGVRLNEIIHFDSHVMAACITNVISITEALEIIVKQNQLINNEISNSDFVEFSKKYVAEVQPNLPQIPTVAGDSKNSVDFDLGSPEFWSIKKINKTLDVLNLHDVNKEYLIIGESNTSHKNSIEIDFSNNSFNHALVKLIHKGYKLNWDKYYHDKKHHKVQLPYYPFQRQRYWIEDSVQKYQIQSNLGQINSPLETETIHEKNQKEFSDDLIYELAWQSTEFEKHDNNNSKNPNINSQNHNNEKIIFLTTSESDVLIDELALKYIDADIIKLQIPNPENLLQYKSKISNADTIYYYVESSCDDDNFSLNQEAGSLSNGLNSFIQLLSILLNRKHKYTIKLITENLYAVNNTKTSSEYANLAGLVRVAANEYPDLYISHIDIDQVEKESNKDLIALVDMIYYENGNVLQGGCAIRGKKYFYKNFKKISINNDQNIIYKKNGVYFIIGGLGGIGFNLCWHLALNYQAKLIIVGRSQLSKEKQQLIQVIKSAGSTVDYYSADIKNKTQLHLVIDDAKKKHGNFNGVFHLAAVTDDKLIKNTTKKDFENAYGSKVFGTYHLASEFFNESLDFFVIFSSFSSLIGTPGQAAYASACAFQDEFTHTLNQQTTYPVKVINWGYWGEVGLGSDENIQQKMQAIGMGRLSINEGIHALELILASNITQAIVLKADNAFKNKIKLQFLGEDLNQNISTASSELTKNQLAESLINIIHGATLLSDNDIKSENEWAELGVDSIISMEILTSIEELTGVRLFPNELLQHNTFSKLLDFVFSELSKSDNEDIDIIDTNSVSTISKLKIYKNKNITESKVVYLLSAPRSGSTLLRVMLMGHSEIFSPPELHLLSYKTMRQRKSELEKNNQYFLNNGLQETLSKLNNISAEEAVAIVQNWEQHDASIKEVYQYLQKHSSGQYLVDKSPSYGMDMSTLLRSLEVTPNAYYIHLIRHPIAMMESFVRNRFNKLLNIDDDPWRAAEHIWYNSNKNISNFFSQSTEKNVCVLDYETLVQNPLDSMQTICDMLNIDIEESMLEPYQGDRMTTGLYEKSLSVGDPNFLKHNKIDKSLVNTWQQHEDKINNLYGKTITLANQYHYLLDSKPKTVLPAQQSFLSRNGYRAKWCIIYQLSFQDEGFDLEHFNKSLQTVLNAHECLKKKIHCENDTWKIKDAHLNNYSVDYIDLSQLSDHEKTAAVNQRIDQAIQVIDLKDQSYYRCFVIRQNKNTYRCVFIGHHLILDGVSLQILLNELFQYYRGVISKINADSKAYQGYQNDLSELSKQSLDSEKKYWKQVIANYKNPILVDHELGTNSILSEKEITKNVNKNSKNYQNNIISALYFELANWFNVHDLIIAHRLHRRNITKKINTENLAGCFAGDIPIRCKADKIEQVKSDYIQTKQKIVHAGVGYELLALQGEVPFVYEVTSIRFNYQPMSVLANSQMQDQKISVYQAADSQRDYLLDCIVREFSNHIQFIIRYSENFHKDETIEKLLESWVRSSEVKVR